MGAHHFYATSDPKTFESFKGYFDLIVNTVSVELESVHEFAGTRWNMVIVGLPEKEMSINAFSLINARRSIAGSVIGGIMETQKMLDFCNKNIFPVT
jgi:uncharacterized zinc-type alcohol dehydrogenase-like protein